jgi:hypothetical protein
VIAVTMAVGIVGTVLPIVPGLWLIWLAAVVYGVLAGFGWFGLVAMAVITSLAIAGSVASFYLPQRRATGAGVPWWGQVLALAAAVIGFFIVPVVGILIGFALGILAVSLISTRDVGLAWEATRSTLTGMLVASGVQFAAGMVMAVVWVGWVVGR